MTPTFSVDPGTLLELTDGDTIEVIRLVENERRKDGSVIDPYLEAWELDGPKNRRVRNKRRAIALGRVKRQLEPEMIRNYWDVAQERRKKK